MIFSKVFSYITLVLIFALLSCNSASVVADEKEPAQAVPVTKISAAIAPAAPNESIFNVGAKRDEWNNRFDTTKIKVKFIKRKKIR